jgi:outer membrane protein
VTAPATRAYQHRPGRALALACLLGTMTFGTAIVADPAFAEARAAASMDANRGKDAPRSTGGTASDGAPAIPETPRTSIRPAGPVTLEEAIQIAFQNHADVVVAEESVEAARQRVKQARAGTLPTLTGQIGYQGRGTTNLGGLFGPKHETTVPGVGGAPPRKVVTDTDTVTFDQGLQPRVSLNYNIYDGGTTRVNVRQAKVSVESQIASLAGVRNDMMFRVASAYIQQLRAERILVLRRVQEELAETQLRQVERRIEVGGAAEADRALPLSELRNRRVERLAAENDVKVAANTLRNVIGLPVGPPLQLTQLRDELPPIGPLEVLRETAMRQRPEVIQAEAQARISQAGVSLARIARKPRLDTQFSFNTSPNNDLQRGDWAIGWFVSMPLWDAGVSHSREQEARTQVSGSLARLEQIKKDVAADVEEAYLNLVSARERLAASRLAVEAAQTNLEVTTARYEQGLRATIVDLIEAQVQFANANNNAIQARYDLQLALAQLNRALAK